MPAARRVLLLILALLLLLLFFAVPTVSIAQDVVSPSPLADAARQLAERLAGTLQPREALALTVRNLTSLNAADIAEVRRRLEEDLTARGFSFGAGRSGASSTPEGAKPPTGIRLTVSENLEGFLLILEVAGRDLTLLQPVPSRPLANARSMSDRPMISIRKELVWEDPKPILDFAEVAAQSDRPPGFVVLGGEQVSHYQSLEGSWRLAGQYAIDHTIPPSRDPRGALALNSLQLQVALPGVSCAGSLNSALTLRCTPSSELWPEGGAHDLDDPGQPMQGRNYFTIRASEKLSPSPFRGEYFSVVALGDGEERTWLVAQLDGQVGLYRGNQELVAKFNGWGSDLERVAPGCGNRRAVLVAAPGDWTTADSLRAFEIEGAKAIPVSPSIELPGPILVLREHRAVARNLETGRYEAYRIAISCGK